MKQTILLILIFCTSIQIGRAQNNKTTIAYIDQFKAIAMKEMKRTGVPASITLAQAIVALLQEQRGLLGRSFEFNPNGRATFAQPAR
jgi:hypothetical protein